MRSTLPYSSLTVVFPPEAQFSAHALEQFVVDRHTFFVADVADARMDLVL
jgi:hypothetical protein